MVAILFIIFGALIAYIVFELCVKNSTEKEVKKSNSIDIVNKEFFDKHLSGFTPDEVVTCTTALYINGDKNVFFPTGTINRILNKEKGYSVLEERLSNCATLNNDGVELEKSGQIDDAIEVYENNIKGECYPATHSFDRLMVLYRKKKDFLNELRVIEKAIQVFQKENEYRAKNAILECPSKEEEVLNALPLCKKVKSNDGFHYLFVPYDVNKYKHRLEKLQIKIKP